MGLSIGRCVKQEASFVHLYHRKRCDFGYCLVPYLESPVTYYAAQTDSRDEFESLCNKPERSFLVNFHSKGLAIFS